MGLFLAPSGPASQQGPKRAPRRRRFLIKAPNIYISAPPKALAPKIFLSAPQCPPLLLPRVRSSWLPLLSSGCVGFRSLSIPPPIPPFARSAVYVFALFSRACSTLTAVCTIAVSARSESWAVSVPQRNTSKRPKRAAGWPVPTRRRTVLCRQQMALPVDTK
jgi:hypothetical protein